MVGLKLITLRIENRKNFQINFEGITHEGFTVPTFIIEQERTTVELLRLYAPSAKTKMKHGRNVDWTDSKCPYRPILFQSEKGESVLFLRSIEMDNDNNQITFNLSETTVCYDGSKERSIEVEHFKDVREEVWIVNLEKNNTDITTYQVIFNLGKVVKKIELSVAPKSNIYDIVIDFGSEASQVLSVSRDTNNITEASVTDIAESMKNMLKPPTQDSKLYPPSGQEERYTQYVYEQCGNKEEPNLKFLKSVFLTKKTDEVDSTALKMLTTEKETNDLLTHGEYIILPTVKLCAYGGEANGNIISQSNYYYYRESVSRLFQSELLRLPNKKNIVVNCILLLPNVFTALEVPKIVENLRGSFAEKKEENVKAIEINTISESDASFIGAWDYDIGMKWYDNTDKLDCESENENHFLVLDAGRGTLDASVIQCMNGEFISKYRMGVVGSGNAITYAYMCALIYDFLTYINIININFKITIEGFISKFLCNNDHTFLVNEMWEKVEKYKIVDNDDNINSREMTITKINVDGNKMNEEDFIKLFTHFINFLLTGQSDKFNKLQNTEGVNPYDYIPLSKEAKCYITQMADMIAQELEKKFAVLTKSQNLNIKGAYYTGRAFRCKSFKDAIEKKMMKLFGSIKTLISLSTNPNKDKLLCLLAVRAICKGKCPENTFSLPFLEISQKNNEKGEPGGIGGEILSFLEKCKKCKDFFSMLSKSHKEDQPIFTRLASSPIVSSRYNVEDVDESDSYNRGMRNGFVVNVTSKRAHLCLGENKSISIDKGKSKLFVVNDKFYLVSQNSKDKCRQLFNEQTMNIETAQFAFPTFFPNSRILNGNTKLVFYSDTNDIGSKDNEGEVNTQNTSPYKETNENSSSNSDLSQGY